MHITFVPLVDVHTYGIRGLYKWTKTMRQSLIHLLYLCQLNENRLCKKVSSVLLTWKVQLLFLKSQNKE